MGKRAQGSGDVGLEQEKLGRGGWTWFGGARAISTEAHDFFGSIRREVSGKNAGKAGVFLCAVDRSSGTIAELVLEDNVDEDDHNVPGVVALDDGSILSGHTHHNRSSTVTLSRVAYAGGSLHLLYSWQIEFPEPCTYVYLLKSADQILLLTRSIGFNWTGVWLAADGSQVSKPFVFLPWAVDKRDPLYSGRDGNRPYLIVRPGRDGTFVFVATNDHPRAYRNGVYAGRIRGHLVEDLAGVVVHDVNSPELWTPFDVLTEIIPPGQKNIPWVHDVCEGRDSAVYVAVSGRRKTARNFLSRQDRRRFGYAYRLYRWRGGNTDRIKTIRAGWSMYSKQEDYVGGIAFNPLDPKHVVFSAQGFSETKRPSPDTRWQLWETRLDSNPENYRLLSYAQKESSRIRPVFSTPSNSADHSLFWLEGSYSSYRSIDTEVKRQGYTRARSCFDFDTKHLDLPFPVEREALFPDDERQLFDSLLATSKHFLEFGSGSSTLRAIWSGVERITTIDSDGALLTALSEMFPLLRTNDSQVLSVVRLIATYTGRWGYPKGTRKMNFPAQYRDIIRNTPPADLVLIDGRYRVASFLEVVRSLTGRTTVLWDDYVSRAEYHVVEKLVGKPDMVGRMAKFVLTEKKRIPASLKKVSRSVSL